MKTYLLIAGLLAMLLGCATPEPQYSPLPETKPRPNIPPLIYPPESQQSRLTPTGNPPEPKKLWLEWDYTPNDGPVWFEVWKSNDLSRFQWAGGTNIPSGFRWWTNVMASPVLLTADKQLEVFIVRTANELGFSDWAR